MITLREVKIFIVGMITAFFITLIVINSRESELTIISEVIQDAVIASTVALILGVLFRIVFSIFTKPKKKIGE